MFDDLIKASSFDDGYLRVSRPESYDMVVCHVGYVLNDIRSIQKSFISLGFHLNEMQVFSDHSKCGWKNFYEFCEATFHLSRSSVQRYIAVWKKFCAHGETTFGGSIGMESSKMFIDDQYKDFEYSQLVEMLNMPHPEVVTSDMTIKQIRELKKKQKNAAKGISNHSKLSEEKKENNKKCPVRSFRGHCGYCYYVENEGCLYPDQKDVFALPAPSDQSDQEVVSGKVCDVAQIEKNDIKTEMLNSIQHLENFIHEGRFSLLQLEINRIRKVIRKYPDVIQVCDVAQPEEQSPEEEFNIDCLARLDLPDGSVCLSTPCLPEQVKQAISNYVGYLESNSFAMTDQEYIQHFESIIEFLLKL